MRQILVTVLLIIVIIAIYNETFGGDAGMKASIRDSGGRIGSTIQSINP